MRKDFSEASKEHFKSIVRSVESEKLCDFTDWLGDRIYDFQAWIGNLQIGNYLDDLDSYHKKIIDKNNTTVDQIDEIFTRVHDVDDEYYTRFVNYKSDYLQPCRRYIIAMIQAVSPGHGMLTPQQLTSHFQPLERSMSIYVNNPAFDSKGQFGGDQGSPQTHYKDLKMIVKKYYPKYTDKQIKELLAKLNNEGCGYVALCNTLFAEFIGREKEFEQKFGFPMYIDGELNYDALVVDLYCAYDDRNSQGTTMNSRKPIWENYMKDHNVNVVVTNNIPLTPENYYDYFKRGQIVVAIEPVTLRDKNGKIVMDVKDAGHAMTVTGVTQDGMYIVSSWGATYYINPNDKFNRLQFQQLEYR